MTAYLDMNPRVRQFVLVLLVAGGIICSVTSFGLAMFSVADAQVVSETPVSEYSGEYVELEEQSNSIAGGVYRAIESDGEGVQVKGIIDYSGAYEVDGVVYEVEQSRTYVSLFGARIVF